MGTRDLALRVKDKHGDNGRALDSYGTGPGTGYAASILRAAAALKAGKHRNPLAVLTRWLGKQRSLDLGLYDDGRSPACHAEHLQLG